MEKKIKGSAQVVVGGQWGDEGKGRVVDVLAESKDMIVRFQGGNNAGHSLHIDESSIVLHLIPCGIMRENKVCFIGNGVVIDPEVLFAEILLLKSYGIEVSPKNLRISRNAHIILPMHKEIDAWQESSLGRTIGTTKRGIGPCYEDKIARMGILAQELVSLKILKEKIALIAGRRGLQKFELSAENLANQWSRYGDQLKPFLCDVGEAIHEGLTAGKTALFEGAQGTLLDVDHGSYPYVTSSNCVASHAATGSGIGPTMIDDVVLVTKAYCTRVGEGPFFSEMADEEALKFRTRGNEFGATTGRSRRCGWLDLPALAYASRLNGASSVAVTKIDVLAGMGTIQVCTGYRSRNGTVGSFSDAMELTQNGETITPIYQELGEAEPITNSPTQFADFSTTYRKLFEAIEQRSQAPITMVTYGPKRGDEIAFGGGRK